MGVGVKHYHGNPRASIVEWYLLMGGEVWEVYQNSLSSNVFIVCDDFELSLRKFNCTKGMYKMNTSDTGRKMV